MTQALRRTLAQDTTDTSIKEDGQSGPTLNELKSLTQLQCDVADLNPSKPHWEIWLYPQKVSQSSSQGSRSVSRLNMSLDQLFVDIAVNFFEVAECIWNETQNVIIMRPKEGCKFDRFNKIQILTFQRYLHLVRAPLEARNAVAIPTLIEAIARLTSMNAHTLIEDSEEEATRVMHDASTLRNLALANTASVEEEEEATRVISNSSELRNMAMQNTALNEIVEEDDEVETRLNSFSQFKDQLSLMQGEFKVISVFVSVDHPHHAHRCEILEDLAQKENFILERTRYKGSDGKESTVIFFTKKAGAAKNLQPASVNKIMSFPYVLFR